jgi:hypothetical protein
MHALLLAATVAAAHPALTNDAQPRFDIAALEAAARERWPLSSPEVEEALARNRDRLSVSARRSWAIDRALPMLAGELPVSDDVVRAVLGEVRSAAATPSGSRSDLLRLEEARKAYASRDLKTAAARYAAVAQSSPLWPDALRERAWTLLLLGRPGDALGATVSLSAPYFPQHDHMEGRLMKASILLNRCRFDEARAVIAPLADSAPATLTAEAAHQALESDTAPAMAGGAAAWNAPLVVRVRAALGDLRTAPRREEDRSRITELGTRLLLEAFAADSEVLRDARERALAIRYESLRTERRFLEQGLATLPPARATLPPLEDDEIGWDFDGTWWRDELGSYRYTAGNACPRGLKP